jgi:hypothetical protein
MKKILLILIVTTFIPALTSEARAIVQGSTYEGVRTEVPQTPGQTPAPNPDHPNIDWDFTTKNMQCCNPLTEINIVLSDPTPEGKCRAYYCIFHNCVKPYLTPPRHPGIMAYSKPISCKHPIFESSGSGGFGDF